MENVFFFKLRYTFRNPRKRSKSADPTVLYYTVLRVLYCTILYLVYYTVLYCTVQCTLNSTYCTFVLLVEKNCSGKQLPFLLLLTLIQTTAILKHKIKLHKNSIINIMKLFDMSVLVLLGVKFHLFFKLLLWSEFFRASDSGLD